MPIFVWIILGVVAFLIIPYFISSYFVVLSIAKKVYHNQLVRTTSEKWGRECSCLENEEQVIMWNSGLEWAKENAKYKKDISITNDNLKLVGEYYDYGAKRCVLIVPGRAESLMYSYYFAQIYTKTKCNIFVMDTRAHGLSDGKYNTTGVKEAGDLLAWVKYLHDEYKNEKIIFHGICIGAATGVFALADSHCPSYIDKFVNEGCYISFYETFKQHMVDDHRKVFPFIMIVMRLLKKNTGVDMKKDAPIFCVDKLKCQSLFIYGKEDKFSRPDKSQMLFDKCGSKDKRLVWMDKGAHSHLRINNLEAYDKVVLDFINEGYDE